jgi:hypothetical protein
MSKLTPQFNSPQHLAGFNPVLRDLYQALRSPFQTSIKAPKRPCSYDGDGLVLCSSGWRGLLDFLVPCESSFGRFPETCNKVACVGMFNGYLHCLATYANLQSPCLARIALKSNTKYQRECILPTPPKTSHSTPLRHHHAFNHQTIMPQMLPHLVVPS